MNCGLRNKEKPTEREEQKKNQWRQQGHGEIRRGSWLLQEIKTQPKRRGLSIRRKSRIDRDHRNQRREDPRGEQWWQEVVTGHQRACMGSPPCLQPKFHQQVGVEGPSLLGTHPAKPRAGGVTSRVQAILRPNSIWQTVPIGNQCPSLGGFNFMAVCTNLQLLIGRAELRASSQGCSDGVWCLHCPSIS